MRPSEHDAVREARDALVVIGSVTPPVVILAALFGVATGQLDGFLRWIAGTLLMASILLICLASALLVADRVARRWWDVRPHALRTLQLIPGSLGVALLLVAGYPTTEPVIIGLTIVALALGAIVAVGAALDM
ncbi:MAG TPA: hypothetical protein VE824_00665 [Gaiellales bacterium]|nr:hypothetical protein [Gaiellales bacterium]